MTLRLVRLAALVAMLVFGLSLQAAAHAILIDSTPKPDGTMPAGHQTLSFHYNSRIDHKRSRLTLVGPSGKPMVLRQSTHAEANALDAEVDLAPGHYTLRWQALALDGHITRGDVPFSVAAGAH